MDPHGFPRNKLLDHGNKLREGSTSLDAMRTRSTVQKDILRNSPREYVYVPKKITQKSLDKAQASLQDGPHGFPRNELLDHGNKVREGSISLDAMRTKSTLLDDIIAKRGNAIPFKKPTVNPESISNKLLDESLHKKPIGKTATGKLGVDYGQIIPRSAIKPKPVNNSFTQDGAHGFPRNKLLDHGNKVREGFRSRQAVNQKSTLLDDIIAKRGNADPFKKYIFQN